jgi:hypothetical protein
MLPIVISQLGYFAIWSIVFAGGMIFLRRGQTTGAMPVLFGAGILVLMEVLYILVMILTWAGVMDAVAGSRMYQVMWVPQLAGGFLFALGFLQLARASRREV